MFVSVLPEYCSCAACMPGACRGQKRSTDPLELEIQAALSYHNNLDVQYRFSGSVIMGQSLQYPKILFF